MLASRDNQKMKNLQMDVRKDNENPGAEKLFVMFLLDFMVFQYSFQNSIEQLNVWHVLCLLKKLFFLQIKKILYTFIKLI